MVVCHGVLAWTASLGKMGERKLHCPPPLPIVKSKYGDLACTPWPLRPLVASESSFANWAAVTCGTCPMDLGTQEDRLVPFVLLLRPIAVRLRCPATTGLFTSKVSRPVLS